jgi:microcystin-dependent protein
MSVSAVSSAGQQRIALLQTQLQKDQKALIADQRSNANQQVQQQDHAKVQQDQDRVSVATKTQAQAAAQAAMQAAAQAVAASKTAPPPLRPTASAAPGRQASGSLYL